MSLTRQEDFLAFETAPRGLVGFGMDYSSGFSMDFHSHSRAQLMYATSGVMRVETSSANYMVPPTTALFLPAHAQHAVSMNGAVALRIFFLRRDMEVRIGNHEKIIVVSGLLKEIFLAMCAEPVEWDLHGRGHHLSELAINEITNASPMPFALPMPLDSRARRVASQLLDCPEDRKTLEEWGEIANASSRTLARLFQAETGLSFRQWRLQARLIRALHILTVGGQPARAAAAAGFNSIPAFGVAFRKQFGVTPGQVESSLV